jgi:hypothetical protein
LGYIRLEVATTWDRNEEQGGGGGPVATTIYNILHEELESLWLKSLGIKVIIFET